MPTLARKIGVSAIRISTAPLDEQLDVLDPDSLATVLAVAHQRVVVRYAHSSRDYVLLLGHQVLRAAQDDGRTLVDALILNWSEPTAYRTLLDVTARQAGHLATTPLEEAALFHLLNQQHSRADIAASCGIDTEHVRRRLRLMRLCLVARIALAECQMPLALAELVALLDDKAQITVTSNWLVGSYDSEDAASRHARTLMPV